MGYVLFKIIEYSTDEWSCKEVEDESNIKRIININISIPLDGLQYARTNSLGVLYAIYFSSFISGVLTNSKNDVPQNLF